MRLSISAGPDHIGDLLHEIERFRARLVLVFGVNVNAAFFLN
jgi:hypothetical protein